MHLTRLKVLFDLILCFRGIFHLSLSLGRIYSSSLSIFFTVSGILHAIYVYSPTVFMAISNSQTSTNYILHVRMDSATQLNCKRLKQSDLRVRTGATTAQICPGLVRPLRRLRQSQSSSQAPPSLATSSTPSTSHLPRSTHSNGRR